MLLQRPKEFERMAREWAIRYAGAPKKQVAEGSGGATDASIREQERKAKEDQERIALAAYVFFEQPLKSVLETLLIPLLIRYDGYNKDLVDRFCGMGFDIDRVVAAFKYVGIDRNNGADYELEAEYVGDITAYLLGES